MDLIIILRASTGRPCRSVRCLRGRKMELHWPDPELTDKGIDDILDYEISSSHLEDWPVYTIRSPKMRPADKTKTEPYKREGLPALRKQKIYDCLKRT